MKIRNLFHSSFPSGAIDKFKLQIRCPAVFVLCALSFQTQLSAQGVHAYAKATTDQLVHTETPMTPPPVNVPFVDPDLGSQMIRVTDQTSNFLRAGGYLRTEASGSANMFSSDSTKLYVIAEGGATLAYSFDPSTMAVGSLPGAKPGKALLVPLRAGASFSFTDPDLMYGTNGENVLQIASYRFSTGKLTPVVDTLRAECSRPWFPAPGFGAATT